jgi:Holliday junction DNA helicase RuvA
MIGQLKGILSGKHPPHLLLDVNGVGYEIEAPMSTFYVLPEPGETVQLLIHTHVREDALQLFGFASTEERELFRTLIKVSGVGAKLALTILSGIEVSAFVQCVQAEDSTGLTRLPGVGKKTAERLIVEMKDRLSQPSGMMVSEGPTGRMQSAGPIEEAVTALIALGYKAPEASRMVRSIPDVDNAGNTEEIIRQALKAVVR